MDWHTVVLVSTQRGWRGGEEQARQLVLGLRQRGHRVHIVARAATPFAERMKREGFEVREFSGGARSAKTIWFLRKLLRRIRPDVLHYNDPHALTSAGIASVGLKIPARVMARRVDFPLSSSLRYRWFADRVVCVSRFVAQVCREGGVPDDRLSVVYDGVDPQRMSEGDRQRGRDSLKLAAPDILLLTVAAFSDHKGHRFLLDAMPEIIQGYPKVVLALAGEGELEENLRAQAASLGVESKVRFLGFRQDVADLIHAADLFVMPSRLEGLCSTLIDVMLAGTPIVATTAGGIPELLMDEKRDRLAWLVPPESPQHLAEAVLSALSDEAARADASRLARERALEQFTSEQMVEGTLQVYESILAKRPRT